MALSANEIKEVMIWIKTSIKLSIRERQDRHDTISIVRSHNTWTNTADLLYASSLFVSGYLMTVLVLTRENLQIS